MMVCLFLIFTGTAVVNAADLARQIEQEIRDNPELKNRHSQWIKAWDYRKGDSVPKNLPRAFVWMKKSAEQGYGPAQCGLGTMYEEGVGVAGNDQQAVYWYQKGTIQNNRCAMNNLARYLADGLSISKDCHRAVQLYKDAGEAGAIEAWLNLGLLYKTGCGTIPKNYPLMSQFWLKGALKNNRSAQTNMGVSYFNGRGVNKDMEEGYYWAVIAAKRGSENSKKNTESFRPYLTSTQIFRAEKRASAFLVKISKQAVPNKTISTTGSQIKSLEAKASPRRRWSKPVE